MSALQGQRVAVAGDGVTGLFTALRALESGAKVTIYSSTRGHSMMRSAASDKACALWFPVLLKEDPDRIDRWCRESYEVYRAMHIRDDSISQVMNIEIIDDETELRSPPPAIENLASFEFGFDGLDTIRGKPAGTWRFNTFVIAMPRFLRRLREDLMSSGCDFVEVDFLNLDHLLAVVDERIIFNCLGFGAQQIFADGDLREVKGHLLFFPPVRLPTSIGRYDIALIPRPDALVCGTLFLENFVQLHPVAADRAQILAEVQSWVAADLFGVGLSGLDLSEEKIEHELTGTRPCREGGVKLESQEIDDRLFVHNYGHGGSGVTIAPACAADAVTMASNSV